MESHENFEFLNSIPTRCLKGIEEIIIPFHMECEDMVLPKREGGLGLRCFSESTQALCC